MAVSLAPPNATGDRAQRITGGDLCKGGGTPAGWDSKQRSKIDGRALDELGKHSLSEDTPLQWPGQSRRVESVIGICPSPVALPTPGLEVAQRVSQCCALRGGGRWHVACGMRDSHGVQCA
jgi:hypothetical protein